MKNDTTNRCDFSPFLDLFSTSPTGLVLSPSNPSLGCQRNAPFFAYEIEPKKYGVVQGCCNSWTCQRCGQMRAKEEYGRIIEGCKEISEKTGLRFITITTKGRALPLREAEENYLEWTNRFFDACRQKSKRSGQEWHYVQVTERQKRSHPHSHILTTFDPGDLYTGYVQKWTTDPQKGRVVQSVPALRSDWLQAQVVRSGLGEQYDVSIVETVQAASRYVAKYLFKDSIFKTEWPPGWKRVRYSRNFPKLPKRKTDAFILMTANDWFTLACNAEIVRTNDIRSFNLASQALAPYPVQVLDKTNTKT